ncbi:hypothetical protein [Roseitranquillus sediminis]|uniref:hypothetical protein n=1 Tax=Roseitranquillus sediminis TaxID=2809051 RepID=UPI001D0C08CD|nr:hypothetical protein [Roseitranquillus sediminis]MBM9594471.1 hypothetical protein [Roseitranquillus sediminis]
MLDLAQRHERARQIECALCTAIGNGELHLDQDQGYFCGKHEDRKALRAAILAARSPSPSVDAPAAHLGSKEDRLNPK